MASALHVANYLVELRDADLKNDVYHHLSNLKLQKLLYYCHGAHYKWDNAALITDKSFEAWEYGPTIRNVYNQFRFFGQNDIHQDKQQLKLMDDERETIEAVWNQLKHVSAFQLVEQTQKETPWRNAKENDQHFINDQAIREYFRNN